MTLAWLVVVGLAAQAETYTYWIQPCQTATTNCRAGDEQLAVWALEAWERAAPGMVRLQRTSEAQARLRVVWAGAQTGLYGEARPIWVRGRPAPSCGSARSSLLWEQTSRVRASVMRCFGTPWSISLVCMKPAMPWDCRIRPLLPTLCITFNMAAIFWSISGAIAASSGCGPTSEIRAGCLQPMSAHCGRSFKWTRKHGQDSLSGAARV